MRERLCCKGVPIVLLCCKRLRKDPLNLHLVIQAKGILQHNGGDNVNVWRRLQ